MLSKIRLELARTKDYLEGSRDIGYAFTAPSEATGKIDVDEFRAMKARCGYAVSEKRKMTTSATLFANLVDCGPPIRIFAVTKRTMKEAIVSVIIFLSRRICFGARGRRANTISS